MYARSTTVQANPSAIDAGVAHIRTEVLPALMGIDGCIGLSMMADRASGRCVVTSSWASREAMQASAGQVEAVRARAVEILGGSPEVAEWEIGVMHRDHTAHDGAAVRATWMRTDPARLDEMLDTYRMTVLPQIEQLAGFCSASLMVDRATGRAVSSVCYEDAEAMASTRERSAGIRTAASQQAGAEVLDVAEFELAVAHLRVPEMA